MDDAGDVCVCLACSALCGLCCAVAAEEDRRDRINPSSRPDSKNKYQFVDPVAVKKMNPHTSHALQDIYKPKVQKLSASAV